jgi:hypothetical protein
MMTMRALEDESRAALLRQIHADAERAEAAAVREQARELMRRQMVGVDKRWFWDFVGEILERWRAEARQARIDRDLPRAARIDNRVDALCGDLERVERRQLIWEQRR